VAYDLAMFGLLACLAASIWLVWTERMRVGRLERDLEGVRDGLWRAEERAERARADGERALREAQVRAEAGAGAKSRFLATVTHEMRTPLTGLIGTAELLLEGRLAPEQRTYARAILGSAEAMLRLVDEILELARNEAGRPATDDAPFAISDLIEEVAELLAPRAQAKGLDFAALVADDVPNEAVGDPGRIRQILLNLAGNAIKFTTRGGVGLRVDRDEAGLRFTVADTGPGFAAGDAARIFEEFEQVSGDLSAGGVGLGLAISRRLAEAMGGALTAAAEPGRGATFSLILPARGFAGTPAGRPLDGLQVLVASAAPFGGPFLVEALAAAGAEAGLADPEAADFDLATLTASRRAEIVLIDRGAEAGASALARDARRGGAARVILLLAPSERGDLARLSADGFDGYLVKPVRARSLIERIEAAPGERPEPSEVDEPSFPVRFPASGGLTVLVAEDDPVSALIALTHLARLGHASVHVADGLAACEAFEAGAFDAALIDVRMPRLDGLSAARRMRAAEALSGRRPALLFALSANVGSEDRSAALGAGMDGMLAKPLDRRALEALLAPLGADESTAA
jgi:signal transduction histidine kinase/CheY-like chemotaxis protein